jgi:hypothetical protein
MPKIPRDRFTDAVPSNMLVGGGRIGPSRPILPSPNTWYTCIQIHHVLEMIKQIGMDRTAGACMRVGSSYGHHLISLSVNCAASVDPAAGRRLAAGH